MTSYIQQPIRVAPPLRAFLLTLTTLALTAACADEDILATRPSIAAPTAPLAAILGATTTGVPFVVAAINDLGQVAGTQQSGGTSRAVLWAPGSGTQDLGTLGGTSSWAYAINESGQVAGASLTSTGDRHAFLWTPGEGMRDLGTLGGGSSSTARGVNDLGQVVGEATLPPVEPRQPATHAFLWSLGEWDAGPRCARSESHVEHRLRHQQRGASGGSSVLGRPDYLSSDRSRILLACVSMDAGSGNAGPRRSRRRVQRGVRDQRCRTGRWPELAFQMLWKDTARCIARSCGHRARACATSGVSGPVASLTAARGINEAGQVVGESDLGVGFRGGFPLQGFVWTAADGMEALSPTTGIRSARDINNRQQVVGRRACGHAPSHSRQQSTRGSHQRSVFRPEAFRGPRSTCQAPTTTTLASCTRCRSAMARTGSTSIRPAATPTPTTARTP